MAGASDKDKVIVKRYEKHTISPIYWDRFDYLIRLKDNLESRLNNSLPSRSIEQIQDNLEIIDEELESIERLSVIENGIKDVSWQIEFRKIRGVPFSKYESKLKELNTMFQNEIDYIVNMGFKKLLNIIDYTADVVDIEGIKDEVGVGDYKSKPGDISTSLSGLLGGKSKRKSKKRRKSKKKKKISYKKRRSVSKKKKKYIK